MLGLVVDLETGLRGYVVTRDETFLGPYQRGIAAAAGGRARPARRTAGDPAQARDRARAGGAGHAATAQWQSEQLELARRDPDAAAR